MKNFFACSSFANGSEIPFESNGVMQTEEIENISTVGQGAEMQQSVSAEFVEEQTAQNGMNQAEEQNERSEGQTQTADNQAVTEEETDTNSKAVKFKLLGSKAELRKKFRNTKITQYCRDIKRLAFAFADLHKNYLLYNSTAKKWYYYDSTRWIIDEDGIIAERYAQRFFDVLSSFSKTLNDEQMYYRKIRPYDTYDKISGFIKMARVHCSIKASDLDSDIMLFNCQNGTYDFSTYTFREHNPRDYITKISNVWYNPLAVSDDFTKFIREIMSDDEGKYDEAEIAERVEFLQKILAYGLTGETDLDKCFIMYGQTTRNGKSTLMETLYYLVGGTDGYGLHISPATLAQSKRKGGQASEDLARLDGGRFAVASELPKYMYLDGALIKTLTGDDTITARFLYGNTYEFTPHLKLFFNTNHLPFITDESVLKSGRIVVVSFERHFSEEEQDLGLKARLREEDNISGIFNWLVVGHKNLQADKNTKGGVKLKMPKSVKEATREYRNSNDLIQRFVDEKLVRKQGSNLAGKEVYERYEIWCSDNGYTPKSKPSFFEELTKRKILSRSGTVNGQTVYNVVKGYAWADSFDTVIPYENKKNE